MGVTMCLSYKLLFLWILLLHINVRNAVIMESPEGTFEYPQPPLTCLRMPKNLTLIPDHDNCADFDCWECQLTDITRHKIINVYNSFRSRVARGLCDTCKFGKNQETYSDMNFAEWHWLLEQKAQELLKNSCPLVVHPTQVTVNYPELDIGYLRQYVYHEYAATTLSLASGLQTEWINYLETMFESNQFGDWDPKTDSFRRGSVVYFGCATVSRKQNAGVTDSGKNASAVVHFLCMFTSEHEDGFKSTLGPAEKSCTNMSRIRVKDSSLLCQIQEYSESFNDQVPCQVYYQMADSPEEIMDWVPCAVSEKTESWDTSFETIKAIDPINRQEVIIKAGGLEKSPVVLEQTVPCPVSTGRRRLLQSDHDWSTSTVSPEEDLPTPMQNCIGMQAFAVIVWMATLPFGLAMIKYRIEMKQFQRLMADN